jgi:SAM-dependent methyltransferase
VAEAAGWIEMSDVRGEGATVLNLGCGQKRLDGAINLDRIPAVNPDVVHDIDKFPWPFRENQFNEVHANDVIEHCSDVVVTMEEIHRICQRGAVVRITTPHFSSANSFVDPTHRYHFSYFSFHYFTGERDFDFYSEHRFCRRQAQIIFHPTPVNKLIWRLANRYPQAYEQRWAWLFPAWFLNFELEVLK